METKKQVKKEIKLQLQPTQPVVVLTDEDMSSVSGGGTTVQQGY